MTSRETNDAPPGTPPRCAVIGEALVDLFPGRAVIGGAPFNVARNLAALGHAPLTITRLGQDEWADRILEDFALFGLPTSGVQRDAQRPTGSVTVVMNEREHRFEIGTDQAWDAMDANRAAHAIEQCHPRLVYFGTLAQRCAPSRAAVHECLQATTALRFLDLNLRDDPDNETIAHGSLALAHIVKVNDEELARVLEWFIHPGRRAAEWGSPTHTTAIVDLMLHFGLQRLIVTRGAQGYAAFDDVGACIAHGPAPVVVIEDTVGAGDAFSSVVLLGHLEGWPLPATLKRASEFAAAVCTLRGAVTQDRRFYAAWLSRWAAEAGPIAAQR